MATCRSQLIPGPSSRNLTACWPLEASQVWNQLNLLKSRLTQRRNAQQAEANNRLPKPNRVLTLDLVHFGYKLADRFLILCTQVRELDALAFLIAPNNRPGHLYGYPGDW